MDGFVRIKLNRRNLTAIGAVVLAAALGVFVLLDLIFANQLTPNRATDMLEKAAPQLVSVLKTEFGSDFSRIVKAVVAAEPEPTAGDSLSRFLDHETRAIAERHADVARAAPPDLVSAWMNHLAQTMDRVQAVAGPALCARFVNEGPSVLTDPVMLDELSPVFDARDAALFDALAGARDAPVTDMPGEPTDTDWQAVGVAMNGFEVPAGYAQIVASDDTGNRDYCPALAYYFRTLAALPGEAGIRLRAEYFVQSLS